MLPKEKTPSGLLVIEGDAVEDKVSFTLDELKSMPEGIVEADYFRDQFLRDEGIFPF